MRLIFEQGLERKLTAAQTKYQDIEDVTLQLEREKAAADRATENMRKQLETESAKRKQLEHSSLMIFTALFESIQTMEQGGFCGLIWNPRCVVAAVDAARTCTRIQITRAPDKI